MSASTPRTDALDRACSVFWQLGTLDEIMAGAEPLREDESFAVPGLTDDAWAAFIRALEVVAGSVDLHPG